MSSSLRRRLIAATFLLTGAGGASWFLLRPAQAPSSPAAAAAGPAASAPQPVGSALLHQPEAQPVAQAPVSPPLSAQLAVPPNAPRGAAPASQAPAAAAAPRGSCFTLSFTHPKAPGHEDLDDCAQHRNLVRAPQAEANPQTVCVRVDGTPVAFERTPKGFLLGPVAGPQSTITVRYCLGKPTCIDPCQAPRDEFMAALGANPAQRAETSLGTVEQEMAHELADHADLALFSGWVSGKEQPAECAAKTPSLAARH